MATTDNEPRPTVALVAAMVGEVKAMVSEVRATTAQGFEDVQRQLDGLRAMPERVAKLETRVAALEDGRSDDKDERELERAAVARRLGLTIAASSVFVAGVAIAANLLTGS